MTHSIYTDTNTADDGVGVPLEDRIRRLCGEAVAAPQGDLDPILLELQAALREHIEHIRQLAAKALVADTPNQWDIPAQL